MRAAPLRPFPPSGVLVLACAALVAAAAFAALIAPRDAAAATRAGDAWADGAIFVEGARVETATGHVFERANLVLRDGLIEAVGPDVARPWDARRVDATGLTAVPAFIDAGADRLVAHPDDDEERGGRGADESRFRGGRAPAMRGDPEGARFGMPPYERRALHPEVDVARDLALDGKKVDAHRRAGFAAALCAPQGPGLAGRSALVALRDAPLQEQLIHDDVALHATLRAPGGDYPSTLMGVLAHVRQFLDDAQRARREEQAFAAVEEGPAGRARPPADPAFPPVWRAFDGALPVIVHADEALDVRTALGLCAEYGFRPIVAGGAEADQVLDALLSAGAPVLLALAFPPEVEGLAKPGEAKGGDDQEGEGRRRGRRSRRGGGSGEAREDAKDATPQRVLADRDRERDERIAAAAALARADVPFAFSTAGVEDPQEFRENLADAIAAGLPRERALRALTIDAARVLGAERVIGDLAAGLAANVALFDGDPFEPKSRVRYLFVDGVEHEFPADDAKERARGGQDEEERDAPAAEPDAVAGDTQAAAPAARLPELPSELDADRVGFPETNGFVLLRNATVLTVTEGVHEATSVLVRDGRIEALLPGDATTPGGAFEIDCTGLFVTPGIIDCHSHVAIRGGVNEGTRAVTAECRIADELDPEDVAIFRALAGGVTTAQLLHGSANPIGGQAAVVKMRYRVKPAEMPFDGAPRGIKFALGENPKRSTSRYPNTRMGVEAVIRRAFEEARAYAREHSGHDQGARDAAARPEPRRDLRLETLAGILDGTVRVHAHCYRADEILMLLRLADEFGFRIATFQHVLEGYKVAPEIARHGAGASTFSDWWGYKVEAYEAIPYNAALLTRAGVLASLNSDSAELMRRLHHEAAKTLKYGALSEAEALVLVTINPARQLGIDARVGSIEPGKDADLAVWSAHPLSSFSRCEWTLVDGRVAFRRKGHPSALDVDLAATRGTPEEPRAAGESVPAALMTAPVARDVAVPRMPSHPVALVNARIVPVAQPPIERGTLVISDGRIAAVGADAQIPAGAEVVDCAGRWLYPGMIDAGSHLGMEEIEAVDATVDVREAGDLQPDLRVALAVNPDSEHFPVARAAGLTAALVEPTGSLVAGQSALLHLAGWTWEEMALVDPLALHVQVPRAPRPHSGRSDRDRERDDEAAKERDRRIELLKDAFAAARELDRVRGEADARGTAPPDADPRREALLPYARGERPVIFHADRADEIETALDLAQELGVRPIVSGAGDAWKVAARLAALDVPVLLGPVLRNPLEAHDPYDAPFANAAVLHRAGVRFAFRSGDSANARNLPHHAATAAAFGLPRDAALRAVTLAPAEILGVDAHLGSLSPGRIADVVVTDGDLLELRTNVVRLFVAGREVPVTSMQTRLYERYAERIAAHADAATAPEAADVRAPSPQPASPAAPVPAEGSGAHRNR